MAPRRPPTVFQIPVKSHKITVLLSLPPTTPISKLKELTLSAISQFQRSDPEFQAEESKKIPTLTSTGDFELCKAVKAGRKFTGEYSILDEKDSLKSVLNNWEIVFIRFKDENGQLLPVRVALPPLTIPDEDEDEEMPAMPSTSSVEAGLKRKEHPQ